jgi:hypothetical protein
MLAHKFIDLLEAEELLDPEMIAELRRQVSQSGNRLPPETLAKLLVDNDQLTKFQATRLISQLKSGNSPAPAAPPKNTAPANRDEDDLTLGVVEEVDEDDAPTSRRPAVAAIVDDTPVEAVEIVDDDDEVASVVIADVVDEGNMSARPVLVDGKRSEPLVRLESCCRYLFRSAFLLFGSCEVVPKSN